MFLENISILDLLKLAHVIWNYLLYQGTVYYTGILFSDLMERQMIAMDLNSSCVQKKQMSDQLWVQAFHSAVLCNLLVTAKIEQDPYV